MWVSKPSASSPSYSIFPATLALRIAHWQMCNNCDMDFWDHVYEEHKIHHQLEKFINLVYLKLLKMSLLCFMYVATSVGHILEIGIDPWWWLSRWSLVFIITILKINKAPILIYHNSSQKNWKKKIKYPTRKPQVLYREGEVTSVGLLQVT
jgi:hypothetical protein